MDLVPFMEQWHMLPEPGGRVLVAVSGGRDSLCLLQYLHDLGRERGFAVAAGHLNHAMRPEADADEEFVRDFCRRRDIPFYSQRVPVYEMARQWGLTVEEAGRRARYTFLERTAADIDAGRIATAHHLQDQAETVLLHLLRGTGPEGLGGIPPVRGKFIRPLLETSREEIEAYNASQRIENIVDSTNEDVHYARNRLRLRVWPELLQINPAAARNIARCGAIARRESEYLNELAAQNLPETGTDISCAALLRADEVLRRRMVRLLLERLPAGKKDVTAGHIDAVLRLAETGGVLALPAGMQAVCRRGRLTLELADSGPGPLPLHPGENRWGAWRILLSDTPLPGAAALTVPPGSELTARLWQGADRLRLPGSRGSRSVKRLLADRGLLPERRREIPVICVDGRPAYLPGVGIDEVFLPPAGGVRKYMQLLQDE